jgi:hypothetical protein
MNRKKEAEPANEQRYYDVLKRIAVGFQTSDQLRKQAGQYGCDHLDELEMSYENMQQAAKDAIKGRRRPGGARKP